MNRIQIKSAAVLCGALFVLVGCGGGGTATAGTTTSVVAWDQQALDSIVELKTPPPVNARALAIVHTAIFDAWSTYDAKAVGTQFGGSLRRPTSEHTVQNKEKAIAYAAYRALVDLYPARKAQFDQKMVDLGYDPTIDSQDTTTPEGIGNVTAQAVLDFRHADGSNQLGDLGGGGPYKDYTGYVPVNTADQLIDPNRWQPQTFSDGQGGFVTPGCVTPQWGRVTPFAVTTGSALRPPAPAPAGSQAYAAQCQELIDLQANLSDEQKAIAEYWADGPKSVTPPGHWCVFAQAISARDRHTLDEDVKMFFLVANAVMDASICCWETKLHYDYVRPISAIRWAFAGKTIRAWKGPGLGVGDIDGATWRPFQPDTFITPPFPEYTSGHSTFSASSAEVLRRFTGTDTFGYGVTIPAGSSKIEPNITPSTAVTLSWSTFSEAADQAGLSRRFGGIHFADGDLRARQMGRTIGQIVYTKGMSYIDGTAAPRLRGSRGLRPQ